MGRKPLPDIVSPSSAELRALWSRFRADREVRRLIIEIVRVRRLVADVEAHRKSIAKAWSEETGGSHLVALYQLRLLLQNEMRRTGE
ncbi:hypothetical protein [Burkholderia vietnamiensis]|uniref:hypothetical protein n=1 Tax=Burkholderia vietnamiensis TaxID=60552 RepID=UPI0015937D0B|nr:hypothetical protein [Burkholderia vietnamiensis]